MLVYIKNFYELLIKQIKFFSNCYVKIVTNYNRNLSLNEINKSRHASFSFYLATFLTNIHNLY